VFSETWNEDMVCGNTEIQVHLSEQEKGIKIWEVGIKAKSKFSKNQTVSLYFEQVYFKHGCQNTKSGKQFYVFQAYCSGSACRDKDNWGIIDNNANLILAPYKDNRAWKDEIISNN
jgi:hypothetical protein